MTSRLETIFQKDAGKFLRKLEPLLAAFDSGEATAENVTEAFRIMHSIKSEAAHLNHSQIADLAHRAESALDELKSDPSDPGQLNQLFTSTALLKDLLPAVRSDGETQHDTLAGNSQQAQEAVGSRTPEFTVFERTLLAESRERGEALYRLVCDFDPETEMKYPKAVLILNNLEQKVNVIRTLPDLQGAVTEDPSSVAYFFSTQISETELFDAVRVDQVRRVFLSRMAWEQFLPVPKTISVGAGESGPFEQISVPWTQIARLWFSLLAGKIALHRLGGAALTASGKELAEALDGINTTLQATRSLPLEQFFSDLPAIVEQTATEQGKEARCELLGKEKMVERWLAMQLKDSIVQIIRNAVSHGIEDRASRIKAGKSPRGEILLRYEEDDKAVRFIISDDGKGIDEQEVREKAEELGLDSTASLIEIIRSYGFSTSKNASLHSGRGVGLDIVSAAVGKLAGAELILEEVPGGGSRFVISVPRRHTGSSFLFARHKERVIAIEAAEINDRERPKSGYFSRDTEGRVNYRGLPVYTCDGYLFWIDGFPEEEQLLKIGCGDQYFYLLVEELLFEEEFPPEFIHRSENGMGPTGYMMIDTLSTDIELLQTEALLDQYTPGT